VVVDGEVHVVEIDDPSASPMTVRVNGRAFQVEVREGEAPVVSPVPQVAPPTPQEPERDRAPELPTGREPQPDRAPSSPTARVAVDIQAVTAPMPGTILEVYVSPGDHVSYRQDLCILEAMKMKNAIRSPRDGVIAEVRVQPNQAVAYGDVLFVFE
jgi:biotin carboxyl carrier protein